MKNLKNKLNKKGGFTLIEMLIVVAIIAILIAVSIPLVSGALERTKMATDAANERAAKAEVLIAYLSGEFKEGTGGNFEAGTPYYYDAKDGSLTDVGTSITGYGKCTTNSHGGMIIAVKTDDEGLVSMTWIEATAATKDATITWNDGDLCGDTINS